MIDPYKWQGRIVLSNMKDVVEALRIRLSGHFDLVRGNVFHKRIRLAQGEAIKWWFVEYEGQIAITHNYGLDRDGDTVTGDYVLNAGSAKVMGDYISFSKDTIYVNSVGAECYVYIPRSEQDITELLQRTRSSYDKSVKYHIKELSEATKHEDVRLHAEAVAIDSAKGEALSILLQQIEERK